MAVRNEFLKWIAALSQWQTRTSYCYRCIVWSSSEWQPKTIRSVVSTLVAEGEPKPGFQPSRVTTSEASSPTIGSLLRTVSNTDEHAPAIMPHTTTSTSDVVPRRPSEPGYGTSPSENQVVTQTKTFQATTSDAVVGPALWNFSGIRRSFSTPDIPYTCTARTARACENPRVTRKKAVTFARQGGIKKSDIHYGDLGKPFARATRLLLLTSSTESPKYLGPLRLHSIYPLTQHSRPVTYRETSSSTLGPQLGSSSLQLINSST